ncbi:hypothetical protein FPE01S_01_04790 [Flavihumibacter petaseus NBRC 106054]|uniref:Ig-like domain-containing protein n=2 Tax=Flavihumibacter TaxID=1004301 RepID=A0A0E9MVM7_9BACT|nr:hypothetical protein FPE01S_01_04790 [Flavihumibacter petaseus NBRC 106054]
MRKVFYDNAQPDNEVRKLSFYSPSEGYVAFKNWIGYTSDSGRTYVRKYITINNVDYNGFGVNLTFGYIIAGVKSFDKNTLVVYGHYGWVPAILRSVDGGNTFKLVYHSQLNPAVQGGINDMVFPENGNIGYALDADMILKTTNQGISWSVVKTDPEVYYHYLKAPDNNTVYALRRGSDSRLISSTTSGTSWRVLNLPVIPGGRLNYAQFLTAAKGWINMYNEDRVGYFYVTVDSGNSWTLLNDPQITPFSCSKFQFVNDSIGYSLSGPFTVCKTTNGGALWEPLVRDNNVNYLNYSHNDLLEWNAEQVWAGGGNGLVELTTNGGGIPLPKAFFKIDTVNMSVTNEIRLVNYSKPGHQFKWYVNNKQISTNFHTSYTHDPYQPRDSIKLVVLNASGADTVEKSMFIAPIPKPKISSFSPVSGKAGGTITITGSGLKSASAIRFGNFPAASFTVVSPEVVTAVVGHGASGAVHITTTGGVDSMNGFSFIPPPPILTTFSPTKVSAGTVVTISGEYLSEAIAVSFGGVPAASFTIVSPTQVNATVATGASGAVTLTTTTGKGTLPGFTFVPPVSVASFSPATGPVGTVVTIKGKGFDLTAANNIVFFGGVKATVITGTATILTVTVPAGATYDPISVTVNRQTASSIHPFIVTFPGGGSISAASFTKAGHYTVNPSSWDIKQGCLGDIDNDGKLDVVTGNTNNISSISIFRNTSTIKNISFAPRIDIRTFVRDNVLKDMDGDGLLDLVIGTNHVQILKNNSTPGNISFEDTVTAKFFTPHTDHDLAIADIDGDGRLDIAAAVSAPAFDRSRIGIIRNTSQNGVLSFEKGIEYPAAGNPLCSELVDLDGDGRPEMIIGDYYGATFSVYRNLSTPGKVSFAAPIIFSDPDFGSPEGMAAADFDLDGKIDLAIGNLNRKSAVSIFRNTSSGVGNFSFAPAVNCPTWAPVSVKVADLNGDGRPDIVCPNPGEQTASVFENRSLQGGISFAPRVNFDAGPNTNPYSVPLGDLDNDGRTDFVCISYSLESFDVFRNIISESPANAGHDTTICSGTNIQIGMEAIPGASYSWTSSGGYVSTVANPVISPTATSTYYLALDIDSKTYYDTVIVTVKQGAEANAGPNGNICSGKQLTIGVPGIPGNTYNWTSNPVGFKSSVANPTITPTDNTAYFLSVQNVSGCIARDTAVVFVNKSVTPVVSILASNLSPCAGTKVTFTATTENAGKSPAYQWMKNGINVGNNSVVYTDNEIRNGDKIYVQATSSETCASPAIVQSNEITINAIPVILPVITIDGLTTVAEDELTLLTSSLQNSGNTPTYQWQDSTSAHDWQNIPGALSSVLDYKPAVTGDKVRCKYTTSVPCIDAAEVFSNTLAFTVKSTPVGSGMVVPNPVTNGTLIIENLSLDDNWETIEVVSLTSGHKFAVKKIANQTRVSIPIQQLANGSYVATLRSRSGKILNLRFIKL